MNDFTSLGSAYVTYLYAISYIAPAICSLSVTLLMFVSMRSCFNSTERAFRVFASAYSLIITVLWFLLMVHKFLDIHPYVLHVIIEYTMLALTFALPATLLTRHYLKEKAARPAYKPAPQVLACIIVEYVLFVMGIVLAAIHIMPMFWHVFYAVTISLGQILFAYYIIRRGPSRASYELFMNEIVKDNSDAHLDNIVNWLPPLPGEQRLEIKLTCKAIEDHFHLYRPHIDPEFKLSDLAKAMNVNRSEMSAFINGEFGINFRRYVNRWRLAEYKQLMSLPSNERKNTAKIVSMAGFRDVRHYQRALDVENKGENAVDSNSKTDPENDD